MTNKAATSVLVVVLSFAGTALGLTCWLVFPKAPPAKVEAVATSATPAPSPGESLNWNELYYTPGSGEVSGKSTDSFSLAPQPPVSNVQ